MKTCDCLLCSGSGICEKFICPKCKGHKKIPWLENIIKDPEVKYVFEGEIEDFIRKECFYPLSKYEITSDTTIEKITRSVKEKSEKFMLNIQEKYSIYDIAVILENLNLVIKVLPNPLNFKEVLVLKSRISLDQNYIIDKIIELQKKENMV